MTDSKGFWAKCSCLRGGSTFWTPKYHLFSGGSERSACRRRFRTTVVGKTLPEVLGMLECAECRWALARSMTECEVRGCENPIKDIGGTLCSKHYARKLRHGHPMACIKDPDRPYGQIDAAGYKAFGGKLRVREHVLVAERVLGRQLPKGAVVHHVDGNKTNNRHDNLMICSRGFHQWLHAKMRRTAKCAAQVAGLPPEDAENLSVTGAVTNLEE